jgi:hypothetical protein
MNREEAKEILMLYRPGTVDAEDPEIERAMEVARQDPELGRWFENHRRFQQSMRAKFRAIEVPEHLKMALLAGQKIVPLQQPWWQKPVWLAAAAAVILLLTLVPFLPRPTVPDRFANYREMMVSIALKNYRMDWETNDLGQLRQLIASKGAPANFELPPALEKLKLTGGAALSWRSNPVSMVCFDKGKNRMLFLFVMEDAGLKGPPLTANPELAKISSYQTASWRNGDKTYVLVGPDDADFKKFL